VLFVRLGCAILRPIQWALTVLTIPQSQPLTGSVFHRRPGHICTYKYRKCKYHPCSHLRKCEHHHPSQFNW